VTREEKLLQAITKVVAPELIVEVALLKRKLKKAIEQRDNLRQQRDTWKGHALRYQKNLIERTKQ